jgi:hypothetical protein
MYYPGAFLGALTVTPKQLSHDCQHLAGVQNGHIPDTVAFVLDPAGSLSAYSEADAYVAIQKVVCDLGPYFFQTAQSSKPVKLPVDMERRVIYRYSAIEIR